jgi:outer membrane protein assembly factor BamD (BamD/ComL family)
MRAITVLSVAVLFSQAGCGSRVDISEPVTASTIDRDAEAARLYGIAEKLEKEGRTKDALSTYRHIQRDFPKSAQSKKARERMKRLPVAK